MTATELARIIADAREWLITCFPRAEQSIVDASDDAIVRAVQTHRAGGWDAFVSEHR